MINEFNCYAYCCEDLSLIENYDKAISSDEMWDCHHRFEIQDDGTRFNKEDLIRMGKYYNQKAKDLIFLSHSDHTKIHLTGTSFNKGRKHTEEWKQHMSEKMKERFKDPEQRKKISDKMKGVCNTEETRKRKSEATKKRWELTKSKGLKTFKT